jgi:hypothetical protein
VVSAARCSRGYRCCYNWCSGYGYRLNICWCLYRNLNWCSGCRYDSYRCSGCYGYRCSHNLNWSGYRLDYRRGRYNLNWCSLNHRCNGYRLNYGRCRLDNLNWCRLYRWCRLYSYYRAYRLRYSVGHCCGCCRYSNYEQCACHCDTKKLFHDYPFVTF